MESSNNKLNSKNLQPNVTVSTQENDTVKPNDNVNSTPPNDDCCPICFSSFSVACKTNCGHWYCGNCILQYWNYLAASKPCKCPKCSSSITRLNPEASFFQQNDKEINKVLENVDKYNLLFVGGTRGLVRTLCETPLLMKMIIWQIVDPDVPDRYLHIMRHVVMIMSAMYAASPYVPKDV